MPLELGDGDGPHEEEDIGRISRSLREALTELRDAYPSMLHRLRELLLSELHVPNASPPMLADLRSRAENVVGIGGDHRLEAFIIRLTRFAGTDEDMESLASMAANKPPGNWVDADVDRASVELADLAQRFIHLEAFARVKGRASKRHAIAVVVGIGERPAPFHDDFEIGDLERADVRCLGRSTRQGAGRQGTRTPQRHPRCVGGTQRPIPRRHWNVQSVGFSEAA